jgi:hypothetical protein
MNTISNLPPDPDGMNEQRAGWAAQGVMTFAHATGMVRAGEDNATVLGDLLADLMHWCDRLGIDFDAALAKARGMYKDETRPK